MKSHSYIVFIIFYYHYYYYNYFYTTQVYTITIMQFQMDRTFNNHGISRISSFETDSTAAKEIVATKIPLSPWKTARLLIEEFCSCS